MKLALKDLKFQDPPHSLFRRIVDAVWLFLAMVIAVSVRVGPDHNTMADVGFLIASRSSGVIDK